MSWRCCVYTLCLCFLILSGFVLSSISFAETGVWGAAGSLPQKAGVKPVLVRVNNWGMNNTVSLSYQVPQASVTVSTHQHLATEVEKTVIAGNAVPIYNEGEPVLPAIIARIVLPFGHTVDNISVTRGKATIVQGQHFVEFGQAAVALMPGAKVRKAVPKAEIYTSDNPFPAQTHKLVTVQKMRGVTFAFIQIYPVTYYPKSKRLEYVTDISVQVTTKPAAASNGVRVHLDGMKSMCREVENIELLSAYRDGAIKGSYQKGICNPKDEYQWVFVTSNTFANASTSPSVNDLVQHRQSQGLSTKVQTIEEVYSNYDGVDNAEKLRNFVIDAYNNWSTEFVVLGGDVDIVPLRQLFCYVDIETVDEIDSDLYFQCLDGEYNYDNDANWGEPDDGFDYADVDLMAEVLIGRISAGNATEMANAIYKIMAYENSPADENYLKTTLMLGEYLDFGGVVDYAKPSLEQIVNGVDSLDLKGFVEAPEFTVHGLYEMDSSYDKTDVLDRINSESYSIFHHFGHTNASYGLKLRNGDESDFTNDKLIFSYSQGCLTGEFSKDCIAERFTTSTRTGFWGVVFSANLSFGFEDNIDGPAQCLAREFWDAYFGENLEYLGALNKDSHDDNIPLVDVGNALIRWTIYETNVLGDPAVKIRGKTIPAFITVTSPNGGEKWEQGRAFEITWNDNITESVKIELIKGTAVDQELAASEPSDGAFTWNIASDFPIATDYKVRITSTTDGTLVDESFDFFAIEALSTLEVTTPNGGETLMKGSDYEITWSDNLSGLVNIDLYRAGEFCRNVVIGTESDGSYTWNVHKVIAKAGDYKLRVTSVDKSWLFDESDTTFSFENPVITTFPHFEDFDDFELGSGALGGYWEQIEGDDDFNWTVQTGPTPSGTTGPDADHTSGNGKYIFTEASSDGNPNKKFFAVTPIFDFTGLAEPFITFWYHMRSDTNRMGDLYLDIFADNAWTEGVIQISGHQGTEWLDTTLDLDAYVGKQIQFRFRGVTDTSFDSDMAVDDVLIDDKTAISNSIVNVPQRFGMNLYGSRLHYQVREEQHVSIRLYNIQGKLIRILVNGNVKAGYHSLPVNGHNGGIYDLAAGLYLCKMETKGFCKIVNVIIKK